jgi:hypothetical protein
MKVGFREIGEVYLNAGVKKLIHDYSTETDLRDNKEIGHFYLLCLAVMENNKAYRKHLLVVHNIDIDKIPYTVS